MHRVPLWLVGPLGLLYYVIGDDPSLKTPQLLAAMVATTGVFTVPFLLVEWRCWTGRSCGACRRRFVAGDEVYVDELSGRSQMHLDCAALLPARSVPGTWQPGRHEHPAPAGRDGG